MALKEENRHVLADFVPSKCCPSEKRLRTLALRQLEWALAEGQANVSELLKVLSLSEDKKESVSLLPDGWRVDTRKA